MRRLLTFCGILLSSAAIATAADNSAKSPDTPALICPKGAAGGANCFISKEDRKNAHRAYEKGLKLEHKQQFDDAFQQFDEAAKLVPGDTTLLAAREMVKAQLVFERVGRGDRSLALHHDQEAEIAFRSALDLDPENQYARQRLEDAVRGPWGALPPVMPQPIADAGEIHLQPKDLLAAFHYRGDIQGLYS